MEDIVMIVKDTREPKELLAKIGGIERPLEVGDYVIVGADKVVIVERKTISDLVGSFKDNRIWRQLQAMEELISYGYDCYLLLEGELWKEIKYKHITWPRWIAFQISAMVRYGVKIILSASHSQTAYILRKIDEKIKGDEVKEWKGFNVPKKGRTIEDEAKAVLSAFGGVGPVTAERILTEYRLGDFFKRVTDGRRIRGVGVKVINHIAEVLRYGGRK